MSLGDWIRDHDETGCLGCGAIVVTVVFLALVGLTFFAVAVFVSGR